MRLPLLVCLLTGLGALLPGQTPAAPAPDPLAAATQRLAAALRTTAALTSGTFQVAWAPDGKPDGPEGAAMAAMAARTEGQVEGRWHGDLLHCRFPGEEDLLWAGRRMVAKVPGQAWVPRQGRFALGGVCEFAPDLPQLLQRLAAWELAVLHREPGSLDDRPVEIAGVTLTREQVTEAVWGGLLPPMLGHGNPFGGARVAFGGGAKGRAAAPVPEATVDLAIALDPATGLIQQLHFRSWNKRSRPGAAGQVIVLRNNAGGGVVQQADQEEAEEEEAAAAAGPLPYAKGLPQRPRRNMQAFDYTVRLAEHGTATAPALEPRAQQLLGR